MKRIQTRALVPVVLAVVLLLAACVVNPATGKRQLVLMGESQEIQLGLENDKQIVAQLGVYEDADLQGYVQQLGRTLAAVSERPGLDWTFRVVDDPTVNAFALPGGFIYVTRGILAHLNNEAELAAVLGHEIGHVTARHGVNQMSKAQLWQLGFGAGLIFSEEVREYGGALQAGLSLLFLKHSRDDERQADDLGLRYLLGTEFDPRPMPDVFETLRLVGEAAGGGRVPTWMATHPAPENRQARIAQMIQESGQDFSGRPIRRETFLNAVDGIVFGADPRQGYFKDQVFKHPELAFRLTFPEGWKTQNQRQAVVGVSAEQDAVIQLALATQRSAEAALDGFFSQQGVQAGQPWRDRIQGLPARSRYFRVPREQGSLAGLVLFVELDDKVYGLLGFTTEAQWASRRSAIESSLASFDRLTERAALAVQPQRLRVLRASRPSSLSDFARRNDAGVPVETVALLNRMDPSDPVRAGQSYKIVVGSDAYP